MRGPCVASGMAVLGAVDFVGVSEVEKLMHLRAFAGKRYNVDPNT